MFNWKPIKKVADENGIKYPTLKLWVDKGLVDATKSLTGRFFFTKEQEEVLIKKLKGDV